VLDRNPARRQAPDLMLANPVCCHLGGVSACNLVN
jgi:hypothetical protein